MTNNPQKRIGIEGFGLKVVEMVSLQSSPNEFNIKYLTTKRGKLGHLLNVDEQVFRQQQEGFDSLL